MGNQCFKYEKVKKTEESAVLDALISDFENLDLRKPKESIIEWCRCNFPDGTTKNALLNHMSLSHIAIHGRFIERKGLLATFYFRFYNRRNGRTYCRNVTLQQKNKKLM